MLRYLSTGVRWFGRKAMYIHQRNNWEFMAVLDGMCAPLFDLPGSPTLSASRLWVFPPELAHGWTGHPRHSCRVAVFHFSQVPELLERLVRSRGFLEMPLDEMQIKRLDGLAGELLPYYQRLTQKSLLVHDHALLELSLLALSSNPSAGSEMQSHMALHKVESCVIWYVEHMAERPKLEDVAAAVHLSARHLRRLFHEVHNCSPQLYLTRLRIKRASELLTQTDLKQENIAHLCGFASGSDFSRVFKQHYRTTPEVWRKGRAQKR